MSSVKNSRKLQLAATTFTALALAGCGTQAAISNTAATPAASADAVVCKAVMTQNYTQALASPGGPAASEPAACKGLSPATLRQIASQAMSAAQGATPSASPSPAAVTTTPAVATAPAAPPAQAPAGNPPAPQLTSADAVVTQFYQDITDQNYPAAWALGGDNIGGTDYNSWVAGYATTASVSLGSFSYFGSSQVQVELIATQTNGSVKIYTGTYTVTGGVITTASIVQDS